MCLSLLLVIAFGYAFLVVKLVMSSHPVAGAVVAFENTYFMSKFNVEASLVIVVGMVHTRFLSSTEPETEIPFVPVIFDLSDVTSTNLSTFGVVPAALHNSFSKPFVAVEGRVNPVEAATLTLRVV